MTGASSSSELAGWLTARRTALGLQQGEVSARTLDHGGPAGRVTQPYLSRLERAARPLEALTPARQDALRRALEIPAGEWVARTGLPLLQPAPSDDALQVLELVRVPVRALASAGLPVTEDHASVIDHELVPVRDHRPGMLVLEVGGESMTTAAGGGIRPGDRIYVDPGDLDLREGLVYVLHVPGLGLTVKRLRRYGGGRNGGALWLTSDNPDHPPVKPEEVTVVGRVYFHQPRGVRL
ncbi:S24 family peptidase [Deinococcus radiopugnans]|uniref:Repressor LexA n=1 Tax=Deinococcus radiopugnans ATCC 19172 TaxID=585398 RepID=A0A5C4Y6F4_9DEIO|nr:S24 family peptidase [Deinococcus radiopugnans]MBB6017746.1 repressor LexA [Deinococcus radiopugnans ATCC 19172]TNM71449.1 S24 family peptidase [Deinococcus radiopugnans ATCC 19172]